MGLDSVELLLSVESEFDLRIPDEQVEKLVRVGDLYRYLMGALSVPAPKTCLSAQLFYAGHCLGGLSPYHPAVDLWQITRRVVAVCYHHRFIEDLGMD